MGKTGGVLLAMTLVVSASVALAAHDYGTDGVNPNIVTNVVQLTYPGSAGTPAGWFADSDWSQCWGPFPWSRDGSKIVFTSRIPGECEGSACNELVMMNADGSGIERLTENSICDSHASFVPPATATVIFQADTDPDTGDEEAGIFSLDVATERVTNLTDIHTHPDTCPDDEDYTENKPAVSPNGQKIAYRSCDTSLWVMDIDGTDPVQIAPTYWDIHHHSWDPTSTYVVFATGCNDGPGKVYMARADGVGDPELLADHSSTDQCANWPAWSPDGQWIAYHLGDSDEDEDEGKAIWLVDPVTKAKHALVEPTEGRDVCGPTSWSPNSRFLAFKMDPDGNENLRALYVVELATDEIYALTDDYWDYRHWFSPDGAAILFRDAKGSGNSCQSSRDDCQNGADLLLLNLGNSEVWAGDAALAGAAVPATTRLGLLGLALMIAGIGVLIVRRLS